MIELDPFERKLASSGRDHDDRDKPSWREIDRKREGGYSRHGVESERSSYKQDRETSAHKKKLEKLFKPGGSKKSKEQEAHLKKLRQARETKVINELCASYAKKFSAPDDFDTLALFLEASDTDVLTLALEQLTKNLKFYTDSNKTRLSQQLRILTMMTDSKQVREAAEALAKKLN